MTVIKFHLELFGDRFDILEQGERALLNQWLRHTIEVISMFLYSNFANR